MRPVKVWVWNSMTQEYQYLCSGRLDEELDAVLFETELDPFQFRWFVIREEGWLLFASSRPPKRVNTRSEIGREQTAEETGTYALDVLYELR